MLKYSFHALGAAALVAVCACSHGASSSRANDRLVIGRIGDFQSLNPLLLQGSDTATIVPLVFSYLLTVDRDGRLAPDLAQAVPTIANGGISGDGRRITYRLRQGAVWQDGERLTSADVAFTFRQVMNPRNNVPSRDVYDQIAAVQTPDARTVVVTLRTPNSAVLSYFFAPDGNYAVLPQHVLKGYSDLNRAPFNGMPVGSGPFRVAEWTRGDHLRLVRNDRYFRGAPLMSEILVKILASRETLLIETRTHEIGATFAGSITNLEDYQRIRGVHAEKSPVYGAAMVMFNTRDPMVSDARVRRAIIEAADLPRIVAQASHGTLTVAGAARGFYGPDYDAGITAAPRYDFNAANRLLDEAGWRRSVGGARRRGGVALAPSFVYIQSSPEAEDFAVLLQAELRRAGVSLVLRPYPEQLYAAPADAGGPLFGGRFQLALLQILIPLDPATNYFLGCDQVPPKGFNLTRYCNGTVDRANAASLRTYDPRKRAVDSAIVQREVARNLPFLPVWQQANAAAWPDDLAGPDPSAFLILGNVARWRYRN